VDFSNPANPVNPLNPSNPISPLNPINLNRLRSGEPIDNLTAFLIFLGTAAVMVAFLVWISRD
jgi:hypothetical protein